MKRKLVTFGIAFLLCIGMVGAGFASWFITSDVTNEATGNVTVEEVVDKRLQMTTTLDTGNVVFGGDTNDTATQGWLKYDGAVAQMDIKFTVNVANYADLANDNVTFTVALTDSEGNELDFGDYVNIPSTDNVLTWDMLKTDGTETVTLSFTWGTAFGGVNPLAYYNGQTYEKSIGDAAKTALETLYGYNDDGFKVTITGSVAL